MARSKVQPIKWFLLFVEDPRLFIQNKLQDIYWWNPKIVIKKIEDGEWIDASEPMWGAYYILVGSRRGWQYIEGSLEIRLMRKHGSNPYQMSAEELEMVRRLEAVEKGVEPSFKCGQKIKVGDRARSSYAGLPGIFVAPISVSGGKFARVILDLYDERHIEVNIPIDYLRAL